MESKVEKEEVKDNYLRKGGRKDQGNQMFCSVKYHGVRVAVDRK
jgi:hypothetical protein